MKIKFKLLFGFLLLLFITIAIAAFGAMTLRSVDDEYSYALSYPFEQYSIIKDLGTYFMDARRTMNRAAMYIHDPIDPIAGIDGQEARILYLRAQIDYLFVRYRHSINTDPKLVEEIRDNLCRRITDYELEVHLYFDYYITELLYAARNSNETQTIHYVRTGIYTVDRALEHYHYLHNFARVHMDTIGNELSANTARTLWILLILTVVGVFMGAIPALIISKTITMPIQNVVSVLGDVYSGKLDVNIAHIDITDDEIGILTRDVLGFIDRVKSIHTEVKGMIAAAADKGDLHHVIDVEKYSGEWREIMDGLNHLAEAVDAPIVEIRDVMNELSNGNFNHKVTGNYEGDFLQIKDAVNNTVDALSRYVENELKNERETHERQKAEALKKEQRRIEIAEESSKAKSNFLAKMSHEIRTPITAVMGISEIELQNTDLPPRIQESFAKIHNSAGSLLGIINSILDLSKIEAGKMDLLQETYEVASMIIDVSQLHFAYLNNKNIAFYLYVDENLPAYLVGDLIRIEQIASNVLSNAFKYTDSGSVSLSFECKKCEKDDYVTVAISVKDTGLGMSPEQLRFLHDEYTRFHEGENRNVAGTGLGMSIVYNLVQMMNAHIEIDSEVGMGTKVVVTIPQKVSEAGTLGKALAVRLQNFDVGIREKRLTFEPEPMPYGRVLVVDDVDANLYVAKGLLGFYKLNIETCNSGYEAIEKIKQGLVYDIIFIDHMMPGMNGTEAMCKMRELGYDQPIVVLTANAMIGQAEKFIEEGFDGFISKPIQAKYLNAILVKHIRDKQPPEVIQAAKLTIQAIDSKDLNQNIRNYQENADLIKKLKREFTKRHKNLFHEINTALNAGDIKTAHLLSHTLKGIAGLVKESTLAQMAMNIEHLLRDSKIPSNEQLQALENEMTRVLKSIDASGIVMFSSDAKLSSDMMVVLFDKLTRLLESRNIECFDLLNELYNIPEAREVVEHIEAYDFQLALGALRKARALLGV